MADEATLRPAGRARAPRTSSGGSGFLYTAKGKWLVRVVTFIMVISTWELYGRTVSRALFAPPSAILGSFQKLAIASDTLVQAFAVSMGSLLIGFAGAMVVGVTIGTLMGRNRTIESLFDPYVSFLYALPTIALIPVLIIWVGIDLPLRVLLVFLSGVFLVIINTMVGVKHVDKDLVDVARTNCATELQVVRTVVLPGALPYIFAGMRVALAQSLIGIIVAEMTTTVTGLGAMIINAANFFRTADMFVPILTIMMTSVVLTEGMRRLQARLTPWAASR
ncbi:ABC transporter permease subunit [soil metagenome]